MNPTKWGITIGAMLGILLLVFSMTAFNAPEYEDIHSVLFLLILFVGGTIYTSQTFSELHENTKSFNYLTLPASNLEKFLSKLLFSTVVFIIGALIAYFIFAIFGNGVVTALLGKTFPVFNPFGEEILKGIGLYIIMQSVFFLGAIYFSKYNLIKTIFSLFVLGIMVVGLVVITNRIVFWDLSMDEIHINNNFEGVIRDGVLPVLEFVFLYMLAPFFWFVSYLRLKEREV